MDKLCVVFVCNKPYFDKFIKTCNDLLTKGNYKGDICLVIGDDLQNDSLLEHNTIRKNNIHIKHFPNIIFPEEFLQINNTIKVEDDRHITKKFQWHKLYLFDIFFKKWDYIFYIDCGMSIFSDISPILKEKREGTLLAHSDAYPTYEWKLNCQFYDKHPLFNDLHNKYNLFVDYFQSGILLFDTKIIENDTFDNLWKLSLEFPISRTNEQGIVALYFTNIKPVFQQIKTKNDYTFFYDYWSRDNHNKYIMLKY